MFVESQVGRSQFDATASGFQAPISKEASIYAGCVIRDAPTYARLTPFLASRWTCWPNIFHIQSECFRIPATFRMSVPILKMTITFCEQFPCWAQFSLLQSH